MTAALRQFLEHMELREKLEEYRDFFLERKEPGMRTWPGNMARSMTAYWNCLSGWKDFGRGKSGYEELYPDSGRRLPGNPGGCDSGHG